MEFSDYDMGLRQLYHRLDQDQATLAQELFDIRDGDEPETIRTESGVFDNEAWVSRELAETQHRHYLLEADVEV